MGVDAASPVVEIYSPGTVLQVSQVENLSPSGTWRLRTAEGWVAERNVADPDEFYTERLEQDTCDFAGHGAGPERCVFVDVLRLAAEPRAAAASARGGSNQEFSRPTALHGACKDIVVGESFAELLARGKELVGGPAVDDEVFDIAVATTQALSTPPRLSAGVGVGTWHEADAGFGVPLPSTPCGGPESPKIDAVRLAPERRRPRRSLLTRSVEVGDADAVTFFVELFVPAGGPVAAAVGEGGWAWGVVIADFDVYLTTRCKSTEAERDNGGGGDCSTGAVEESVATEHAGAEGRDDGAQPNSTGTGKLLHIVIEGPGGFFHALPVCAAFRGRWMTLRIVAHRSGESLLVCTPGAEQSDDHERSGGNSAATPWSEAGESLPDVLTVETSGRQQQQQRQLVHQQRQLRCRFSNPRFFRGDRVGCVGLYSERFSPPFLNGSGGHGSFRFLARHAVILLGSLEEQPPPALQRLRQLERLVSAEHSRRLTEPMARPLLVFARRLRQLWSVEVPVPATSSFITLGTEKAGVAAADHDAEVVAAKESSPTARRASTSTLTVWQALLSPGRVAFGSTVCLFRNGTRNTPRAARGGADGVPVQRRSLTAWEHPALQTPARFEAVPLPGAMSTKAADGQGLWAWAPVPRSEAFVAIGVVFTGEPEPPQLKSVRCVRREFVVDAEPQKCKVIVCFPVFR